LNWNQAHGLNIYDMGKNCFLFEFASMKEAEHALRGSWFWKKQALQLQWWTPTVGAAQYKAAIKHTWIRLVGLPLHLWSEKVFKAVGDFCGGWISTEEETNLRNHLKWARIPVKGWGNSILKEVRIEFEGTGYIIQIWNEAPVRFYAREEKEIAGADPVGKSSNQRIILGPEKSLSVLEATEQTEEHVGCSNFFETRTLTRDWTRDFPLKNQAKGKERLDLDPLAQFSRNYNNRVGPNVTKTPDPVQIEIEVNKLLSMGLEDELVNSPGTIEEAYNGLELAEEQSDDDAMSIIQMDDKENFATQAGENLQLEEKEERDDTVEDILPLNSTVGEGTTESEKTIPMWVQQNIIELSKEFGVHFQGCEEAALKLFMKIDGKRQVIDEISGAIVPMTPKEKISKELKNLEPTSNFISFGTRSRGGCFVSNLNEG